MVEWVYVDADGAETGTPEPFDTQAQAETRSGTNWEALADRETTDGDTGERQCCNRYDALQAQVFFKATLHDAEE